MVYQLMCTWPLDVVSAADLFMSLIFSVIYFLTDGFFLSYGLIKKWKEGVIISIKKLIWINILNFIQSINYYIIARYFTSTRLATVFQSDDVLHINVSRETLYFLICCVHIMIYNIQRK